VPALEFRVGSESVSRAFWGDAFTVRASGLPSEATVTLRFRADMVDSEHESWATFRTDAAGSVDVATMAPEAGSWTDADIDGPVWSMSPVTDGEDRLAFNRLQASVEVDGAAVASADLDRYYIADDVVETPVAENGLVGVLYARSGAQKLPVVIAFGGSEGGLSSGRNIAAYYASLGYAALGLAYFAEPGLPSLLEEIPLEYFDAARAWLDARPEADATRVAVMGGSRGGELALLLGATFPWVKAVIATLPSGVMWSAPQWTGPDKSSWTFEGQGLPFVDGALGAQPTTSVDTDGTTLYHHTPVFLAAIAEATPAEIDAATPHVENTAGPVLMLAGADDQLWPACELGELAMKRLEDSGHAAAKGDELVCFPDAGHNVGRPGSPSIGSHRVLHPITQQWLALGGTPRGVAHARRQADDKIRALLESAL